MPTKTAARQVARKQADCLCAQARNVRGELGLEVGEDELLLQELFVLLLWLRLLAARLPLPSSSSAPCFRSAVTACAADRLSAVALEGDEGP